MKTSVNNKCKAFTSLEQSRKLAKILSIESADMCYRIVAYNPNDTHEYQPYCFSGALESDIPCWSLAALLSVLPKIINNETLFIETSAALWHIGYRNIYIARADNPVDACVYVLMNLKCCDYVL